MDADEIREKWEEFETYVEGGEPELAHIKDKKLELLYGAIMWDPDGVIAVGEELVKKCSDPLAVLEAMLAASGHIESDIEEHGEVHGDAGAAASATQRLETRIAEMRASGKKSDVFSKYEEARTAADD